VVGALGGIDAALETAEGVCAAAEGLAGGAFQGPGVLHFAFEDLGIDSAKVAEQPLVVDTDRREACPNLRIAGGWAWGRLGRSAYY
jgi:hypothetical protein